MLPEIIDSRSSRNLPIRSILKKALQFIISHNYVLPVPTYKKLNSLTKQRFN
jgi:hypothetical protein